MSVSQQPCRQNPQHAFLITEEDQQFYQKIGVPPPTLCPDCRLQQRLAFRNERTLYNRKCDLSGKEIISMYAPEKPYTIYEQEEWWSDAWDALSFGQEMDFQQPFFKQFQKLLLRVPRLALLNERIENSKYCNYVATSKNCYLCYASMNMQSCLYSAYLFGADTMVDSLGIKDRSELGYENIDCSKIYNVCYSQNCNDCHDVFFCYDCRGCNNCIGCVGLRHKSYHILNQPVSPEKFQQAQQDLKRSRVLMQEVRKKFAALKQAVPHRFATLEQTENASGDCLTQAKNVHDAYYSSIIQDCAFVHNVVNNKDCYDLQNCENSELCYFCSSGNTNYRTLFFDGCCNCKDVLYSSICFNCENVFGCVGLRKKQYCILNKQYTKEEYEKLVPKIIDNMQKTGEWGEYFPIVLSPFAYNESVAYEYFPLEQQAALQLGSTWKEEDTLNRYEGPRITLPENIDDVTEEITRKILSCDHCHKNYKIIAQELDFYKKMSIPLPQFCPNCRHRARLALRNPRKLWRRNCAKCNTAVQTTYAPERPEIVYCEACYQKEVY